MMTLSANHQLLYRSVETYESLQVQNESSGKFEYRHPSFPFLLIELQLV